MTDRHTILGFSTSGPYCGVALFVGDDVPVARHEALAKGQAERLMPMIQEVLDEAGLHPGDLDALGVGVGPGNFTGIRISVAAARGMALGLGIPAVGVNLLEALALGTAGPRLTCILGPRGAYYLQRFGPGLERGPALVEAADLDQWAAPGLTCIGNDEATLAARLGATPAPAMFYPASAVARIAAQRWQDTATPPVPLYIRAPDAAPSRTAPPALLP